MGLILTLKQLFDAAQATEYSGGLEGQKYRLSSSARSHHTQCLKVSLRNQVLNGVARVALDRLRNQPDGFGLCLRDPNPCLCLPFGLENGRLLLAFCALNIRLTLAFGGENLAAFLARDACARRASASPWRRVSPGAD